jgi:RNA methyltransferase, TrmH family
MARRADELKIYGRNAAMAILDARPDDLIKAWVAEPQKKQFAKLLKACAQRQRAYHLVGDDELEALAESKHHEGVVLLVRERALSFEDWLAVVPAKGPALVLALDRVQNPFNLGAIVRTAAHFDAWGIVVAEDDARLSGAAYRTAEGGAEHVPIVRVPKLARGLEALKKAGFRVLATSGEAERSLHDELPERAVFLLGSEGEGLDDALFAKADATITIPGSGRVESLNVSAATAVLCAFHHARFGLHSGRG